MLTFSRAAFAAAFLSALGAAQNATVSVLHGIPGLAAPVDVFANGRSLFSFDFGDLRGPLSLPSGSTNLEVKLGGRTVLQLSTTLEPDTNYTVVAHLRESNGIALAAFVNDLSRTKGIGEFFATVAFRHVARAPAVDVFATRFVNREVNVYRNVANGEEGKGYQQAPAWLLGGSYQIRLTPAGSNQTAFGPAPVGRLDTGKFHSVFAIGELGKDSFRLVVQTIDPPRQLPDLETFIRGTACGGRISLSSRDVRFETNFNVILSGGTRNGIGFLHIGDSDSRFLAFRLPLDLSFIGANGCSLYQSSQSVLPVNLDANGGARVTTSIPRAVASTFEELHYQYSFFSPRANPLGLVLTDYASVEKKD